MWLEFLDSEAGRQHQERLRAEHSAAVAGKDPSGASSLETDRRGGWPVQQPSPRAGPDRLRHALPPRRSTTRFSTGPRSSSTCKPSSGRAGSRADHRPENLGKQHRLVLWHAGPIRELVSTRFTPRGRLLPRRTPPTRDFYDIEFRYQRIREAVWFNGLESCRLVRVFSICGF